MECNVRGREASRSLRSPLRRRPPLCPLRFLHPARRRSIPIRRPPSYAADRWNPALGVPGDTCAPNWAHLLGTKSANCRCKKKKCSLTLFDLSVIVGALWSNLSCKYSWVCHEREEITVRKITKFLFHCLFCYLIKSYNIQKLTCDP